MTMSTISTSDFRDALRFYAGGVCLVTSEQDGVRRGMTVSAFVSVSASPPLVAVVIDQAHTINALLAQDAACFAVSMLSEGQRQLADRFAFVKDEDRFLEGCWQAAETGAPVLADALAWLDCRVAGRTVAGSHTIFLGSVVASRVLATEQRPLLYWNRDYRSIEDEPED